MKQQLRRSCLLGLLVLACCTSILSVDVGERRSISSLRSDEVQLQSSQQRVVRLARRLSSRHNELIGGHLQSESIAESAKSPDGTISNTKSKQQESTLEDGLLLSSAGAGKDRKSSTSVSSSSRSSSSRSSSSRSSSDDDDKKTLAQQVKEGKYGLLQNELFAKRPKRPGILSYSSNSEVPRDTPKNLGGLDEDEIWLAENHLLVLKGGNFHDAGDDTASELHSSDASWPPIDEYNAPRRQVKIPPRPKVPPPFPVQLTEGGPVQLIGTNGTSSDAENDTIDFEALPGGFKGFLPGEGPYFTPPASASNASSSQLPALEKRNKAEDSPGAFYPALPPGAVIVPPPSNQTDYDEDQSIYYPPPYSFVYPQDNSTDIPPGPLVPGIILPPPPDFFSSFDDPRKPSSGTAKDKHRQQFKRPSSTTPLPPSVRPSSFLPPRKSSSKLYKTPSVTSRPKTASYSPKPFSRAKAKNSTVAFQRYHAPPGKTSSATPPASYRTLPFVEVTTPLSAKSTTSERPERFHFQPILGNRVTETSTESPWNAAGISSKAVPLVTFYSSSTPTTVDQPLEATPAAKTVGPITEDPAVRYPSQASYYFYEEASNEEQPGSTPAPVMFFGNTAETPPYYKLDVPERPDPADEEKKDYYDVEMIPSRQTSKDYNVKLIDSIVKDPQIYKYLDSGTMSNREEFESSLVGSQSPRLLHSEPLYYQPVPTRSSLRLGYFTTPKPKSYYDEPKIGADGLFNDKSNAKSKPIYQYSFEATNYKRNNHQQQQQQQPPRIHEPPKIAYQQQQQPEPAQIPTPRRQKEVSLFNEYQDIQTVGGVDQYSDYEGGEMVVDQRVRTEKLPYSSKTVSKKKERAYYPQSTTSIPIRATTLAGHQQYFTKQDEQLLDDVTKEYFTMFGKKLSGKLPSTTPVYGKSSVTTERPATYNANSYVQPPPISPFHAAPNIKVHYGDATPGPFSLEDDVLVNYEQPLPPINPDAEFISVVQTPSPASIRNRYRPPAPPRPALSHVRDYSPPFVTAQPPISLEGDVAVNYKPRRPPVNPDAEFISPVAAVNADKANSYFAYRLPGDGGHFYFLTPQAISRQEPPNSYVYSRPSRASRPLPRRRRARDGD